MSTTSTRAGSSWSRWPSYFVGVGAATTTWDLGGTAFRVVLPKRLREALGLTAGSEVDVTLYGAGLQLFPVGATARLVAYSRVGVVVEFIVTE